MWSEDVGAALCDCVRRGVVGAHGRRLPTAFRPTATACLLMKRPASSKPDVRPRPTPRRTPDSRPSRALSLSVARSRVAQQSRSHPRAKRRRARKTHTNAHMSLFPTHKAMLQTWTTTIYSSSRQTRMLARSCSRWTARAFPGASRRLLRGCR